MDPIIVTAAPDSTTDLTQYAAVINVADSPCRLFNSPVPYFWFPIHETEPWGYSPFYGAAKVYDNFCQKGQILVHCHGGISRSPSVACALLVSSTIGPKALRDLKDGGKRFAAAFDNEFRRGLIPSDIIRFLMARHANPSFSLHGLLAEIRSLGAYGSPFSRPDHHFHDPKTLIT